MLLQPRLMCLVTVLLFANARLAHGKAELDTNRVAQIAAALTEHPVGVGQPITNRAPWETLAALPVFQNWLASAHKQAAEPFPKTSDELYLEYSRNGNRTHWQDVAFARRERLAVYTMAECMENKGAFIAPLEEAVREICAEATWVYPAHDGGLRNFKGTAVDIDLGSSRVGWDIAMVDYLLGNKLSPAIRTLIRQNLDRRIFTPYRDMIEGRIKENGWLRVTQNWNAVCHAGVVGAALAQIDDRRERATFVAAAENYLTNFLKGFGTDGYCSEGLGYWNYGFGHYMMLAESVRQATSGKVDFLADPAARLPALFGQRAEILSGIYPSIADCHPGSSPDPQITAYLCRRFQFTPCNTSNDIFRRPTRGLAAMALFCFLPDSLPPIPNAASLSESPLRTWFSDGGVLICRTARDAKVPFAASLKGGHNGEHHNHNDVGSFIVVSGRSMVLVDPGSEVYTARTFSSNRYESDVLSSFGHDVPVLGGKLQRTGAKAHAVVIKTNFTDVADTLSLDLTSVYNLPSLQLMDRTFVFNRATPSLEVRDDVEFTKPETYETALLTWGAWKRISDNELGFTEDRGGVRVKIDTGGLPWELKTTQLQADVTTPSKAMRLGIKLKEPVTKAAIRLVITPETAK